MFVFSFPTFYYTTVGYVNPVLVCLLTLGLYFLLANKWMRFTLVLVTGVFVKETIVLLIFVAAVYLVLTRRIFSRQGLMLPGTLVAFALATYAARKIVPVDSAVGWSPILEIFQSNVLRPRSWLSFLLTFGIPGVLTLFIFRYRKSPWSQEHFAEIGTLLSGVIISIILFGYAMLSAFADGRFIWTSYPFSVPLAAIVIKLMRPEWGRSRPMPAT